MKKRSESTQIYEIKITLKKAKPPIWRRLHVRSDTTLAELHEVIQIAMGWTDSHLHVFVINGENYSDARMIDDDFGEEMTDEGHVCLHQVAVPQSRFVYRYDFGDGWEHEIEVEKAVAFQAGIKTPHCVTGKRACPPEDCGGIWGYADMLEKLAGPPCGERSELIKWLGGEFDPQRFDVQEVNELLKCLQK